MDFDKKITTFVFSTSGLIILIIPAAQAQECLYHSPDWSPAETAEPAPEALREVRLVSIGLDDAGGFDVRMVSQAGVVGDADRLIPELRGELDRNVADAAPRHAAFKPGGTPFDMRFDRDTEVIYLLTPSAWRWADEAGERFFLKAHKKDGVEQRHNPFTASRMIGERAMSVTFDYDPAYEGCAWAYNLGVVSTQIIDGGAYETPVIIDPESSSGTGGDVRD